MPIDRWLGRKKTCVCKTRIIITIIIIIIIRIIIRIEVVAKGEGGSGVFQRDINNLQKPGCEKKIKGNKKLHRLNPTLYKEEEQTKTANLPLHPLSLTNSAFPFPPLAICISHQAILTVAIVFFFINTLLLLPCNGFHSIVPFPIPYT